MVVVMSVAVIVPMRVTMVVAMVVLVVVIMMVVIVVLAHASVPVEGSAICSSISLRTPVIWASAAE